MSLFFFFKIREQDAEQVLPGEVVPVERRRRWGKGEG
jgi:hypothetical protein